MLIMVMGLPGTGKSTFAKALATSINAEHFNTDIIRDKLGLRGQYDDYSKAKVYNELLRSTKQIIQSNGIAVVDGTFYKEELRVPFIKLARHSGQPLHWIRLRAKEQVIRERVAKKRQYSEADFAVYKSIKELFEPLDSQHLTLWSDRYSVSDLVDTTKSYFSHSI